MTLGGHNRKRIAAFVRIAMRELAVAGDLGNTHPEEAMFHAQQAVEKLVRALVEAEGGVAGPTHNIRALSELLPPEHSLQKQLRPLHELSVAATRYRYPTSGGHVFEHEGDVLPVIDEVRAFAASTIQLLESRKLA
jgi:HEPN domain-containing protein